ncbi:peptide-N(4)-(N-acetyl-beta-glucosaminyl)asparagine amidase isoform X1 [Anabrus simplex]|uniref:peptide-N(4)-(N-acetyl-beta- glucosaminyl)asparagine amidase isoform X1 n=1 Tax=Anabrus simplex TaxID=316456 RepID=UPI0035A2CFE8
MTTRNFEWIGTLEENPAEVFLDSTSILLKLMDNVIRNPSNPRYRSIRIANPTVSKKLMSAIGAMECLFEIGFEEDEDRLTLPESIPLDYLMQVREELTLRRNSYLSSSTGRNRCATHPSVSSAASGEGSAGQTQSANQSSGNGQTAEPHSAPAPPYQFVNPNDWAPVVTSVVGNADAPNRNKTCTNNQRKVSATRTSPGASGEPISEVTSQQPQFAQSIRNHSYTVLQYEDKDLQKKALELIPVRELEAAAESKMHTIRLAMKKSLDKEQDIDIMELLLMELLAWFKNSFFSWVDAPQCNFCCSETKFAGLSSNPEELRETKRVEVYICKVCNERTLFPRHHDARKLLETRKGRCGEWASCFTLFCRSMGWETRHVVDQTDHVWTEVYSLTQGRWLHCDPCENVCDQPLIYEKGWGKMLTYVIAYSCDDVQDVTWRYSTDHRGILSRRTLCTEEELLTTLWQVRQERQKGLSEPRRAYLTRRLLSELVEFLVPRKPSQTEFQGRSSGSLAWRLARGETGVPTSVTPYIWEPNTAEKSSCCMQILYSAAQDKYIRVSSKEEVKCWQNGVYQTSGVFRKEEKDWKTVYLARAEGTEKGLIKWKVDCSHSGLVVDSVGIKCVGTTFETGRVILTLCNEEFCVQVPSGDSIFETNALKGCQSFTLNAELTGGKGDVAWQHAQLFRQDIGKTTEFPFSILVKFKKP